MFMNNDNDIFFVSKEKLILKANTMLNIANDMGVKDVSVEVSENNGFSVGVRKSNIETIEKTREKTASITALPAVPGGPETGLA